MKDIALDFTNKKMLNQYIDKHDRIAQQIRVAVRSWKKDFFVDEDFGVDYDNCWGDMLLMKAYITASMQKVAGVLRVNSVTISKQKDRENNVVFKINAEVTVENGSINVTELVEGIY